ncbi:MAG: NAD(P)H-dependent oxidoreductase [Steroidobacteraceae bacterium]
MFAPKALRQQHLHGLTDEFRWREVKQGCDLSVGELNRAGGVDNQHGVRSRFENAGKQVGGKHGSLGVVRAAGSALAYCRAYGVTDLVRTIRDESSSGDREHVCMARHLLVIDGHPDGRPARYMHALAAAYEDGARAGGHELRSIRLAGLKVPLLRTGEEFQLEAASAVIREAQQSLLWADHVLILFPLWLGAMPALLKGFLEQVLRPGFAFAPAVRGRMPRKLLKGRSARIVVTMGMPSLFYRLVYRSHSVKSLERNILAFCGFAPVRVSIIGMVEGSAAHRATWLAKMVALGKRAG